MMTTNNELLNVQRQQIIESLIVKAVQALQASNRLAPHELRASMGFPEPSPSPSTQSLIREAMSLVVRERKAKWDASIMAWVYLPQTA